MAKLHRKFDFAYPVTHRVIRDLKITTEHIGDLLVTGSAYMDTNASILDPERYSVDIDYVIWDGELIDLLRVGVNIYQVEEAALQHAAFVFQNREEAA